MLSPVSYSFALQIIIDKSLFKNVGLFFTATATNVKKHFQALSFSPLETRKACHLSVHATYTIIYTRVKHLKFRITILNHEKCK